MPSSDAASITVGATDTTRNSWRCLSVSDAMRSAFERPRRAVAAPMSRPVRVRARSSRGRGAALTSVIGLRCARCGPASRGRGAAPSAAATAPARPALRPPRSATLRDPAASSDSAPRPRCRPSRGRSGLAERGEKDDGDLGDRLVERGLQLLEHIPAVDVRHHHVEHDQVGRRRPAPRRALPRRWSR